MAKGNVVIVTYRNGAGTATDVVTADKGGRTLSANVESSNGIKWLAVELKTRGGNPITTARYQLTDVVAYTESKGVEETV